MTIHLIKLAVGATDIADMRAFQTHRLETAGQVFHRTRMRPKRQDELLDGGSIYWVVRGHVAVRQRLLGLSDDTDDEGHACCRLVLDPELVETRRQAHQAFQGWRYLAPAAAPPDLTAKTDDSDDLPPELIEELNRLGFR